MSVNLKKEHDALYEQLSILTSQKGNHLDGWYSDTVQELLEGNTVNNICLKGKWPTVSWNGEKLVIGALE